MLTLYPKPTFTSRSVINTPAFARRNKIKASEQMTPQQAKIEASRIASGGMSPRTWRTLDLLATGGVLSTRWLPDLAARTMREWCALRLFDRLSLDPVEIQGQFSEMGLDEKKPTLYTLGPVGVELAEADHRDDRLHARGSSAGRHSRAR